MSLFYCLMSSVLLFTSSGFYFGGVAGGIIGLAVLITLVRHFGVGLQTVSKPPATGKNGRVG